MKKQLKTTVMAIALLATVTGAFATDIANAISGKKLIDYSWQLVTRSGMPIGLPVPGDESSQFSGCLNTSEDECAIGTAEGQPTLYRYYAP